MPWRSAFPTSPTGWRPSRHDRDHRRARRSGQEHGGSARRERARPALRGYRRHVPRADRSGARARRLGGRRGRPGCARRHAAGGGHRPALRASLGPGQRGLPASPGTRTHARVAARAGRERGRARRPRHRHPGAPRRRREDLSDRAGADPCCSPGRRPRPAGGRHRAHHRGPRQRRCRPVGRRGRRAPDRHGSRSRSIRW